MKFSVLMTTYDLESTENLKKSLESILINQTVLPDQMVLVFDGPVRDELKKVALEIKKIYPNEMVLVQLPKNLGQAGASKAGLKYCKHELVARMDSDDISVRNRFEVELKLFEKYPNLDVVGGWIGEFVTTEEDIVQIRQVPKKNKEIEKMFRFRNPINNVTVMMKKDAIIKAGGYEKKSANEDYSLYVQILINGGRFYNIQKILVRVRTGNGMSKRRKDINIFLDWRKDQKKLLKAKKTNLKDYFLSNIGCLGFVIMPYQVKEILYKNILHRKA